MKNINCIKYFFLGFLFLNFLHDSICGICETCDCTQSEASRIIINCQGKHEVDNYTEIFDLLAFNEYKTMKKLILSKYEIVTLPLDAFRGLKLLESLDLSENSVDHFEADIFKDLENLRELDFSFNQLTNLDGAVFENIQSLFKLNLSNNRITELSDTTPGQLSKLTHLDLSRNNLKTIDSQFIRSLSSLEFLDVSYNSIPTLSEDTLLQLRSLVQFRATGNMLKILSGDYPEFLEILDVGRNLITSLPQNFSQIRYLNIADNQITVIPDNLSWLKQLIILNISGNSLISFPDAKFDELRLLDLSRNDLLIVPKTLSFVNLPYLETLLLDGNPIKDLRFTNELRLQRLSVSNLERLEVIESDAFDKINGADDQCINLTISENPQLQRINEGALSGIEICYLDLSKNAFTRISPKVIKTKDKFVAEQGIDLQGNPFDCDCKSQWMLSDLVPHLYTVNPELLEDLRCNAPLELSGARMVHWFKWKEQVFCDNSSEKLSKMRIDTAAVLGGDDGRSIRLESSREMLAIVAAAMGTLCILIIVGIMAVRKIGIRRRRLNRRF